MRHEKMLLTISWEVYIFSWRNGSQEALTDGEEKKPIVGIIRFLNLGAQAMIVGLILTGIFVGIISGFFGVGGGMILVPMLMALGFDIKSAIAISTVQMVFSSINGSLMNYRKGNLRIGEGIWVGVGGILGGIIGAGLTDLLARTTLEYVFLVLIVFALLRILTAKKPHPDQEEGSFSTLVLLGIGFGIGIIAMMLGVGGSVMLTPILVGFLHFSTKKAATAGLFFVVFSSIAGLGYKLFAGTFQSLSLDAVTVLSVAVAALVGVMLGIGLKDRVHDTHHRLWLIGLYVVILGLLLKKVFVG
jgi:uncharacterized membrane protein YfcA